MQDDATDQLYSVVFHVQNTLCSLSHGCISLRKQIVQSLSLGQTLLILLGLAAQFLIGKCLCLLYTSYCLQQACCNRQSILRLQILIQKIAWDLRSTDPAEYGMYTSF